MKKITHENDTFLNDLLNIQAELPTIKKDKKVSFENTQYEFGSLEHIWENVKKTITKSGFFVTHEIKKTGVRTRAMHKDGELTSFFRFNEYPDTEKRYNAKAGQFYDSRVNKPQEQGKEITYGKRYNIVAIFNIQLEGEDNDAQQEPFKGNEFKNSNPRRVNKSQTNCDKCGKDLRTSKAGNKYCPCWYNN